MSGLTADSLHLYNEGKLVYTFDESISQTLWFNDFFFVVVQCKDWKKRYNSNLFCFNAQGKLLWRNKDRYEGTDVTDMHAHYTGIWVENGKLWGANYGGPTDELIDPLTGDVLEQKYKK